MIRLLLALLFSAAPAWALDADYKIGPRDVVEVEIYNEPEMSKAYEVSAAGEISVPFLGDVDVKGLTSADLSARLTTAYRDGILMNPQVTVRVAEHRSQQVEVYGAVNKPGPYYLEGPTTLLEILGRAGWIDTQKSSNQVILRRETGDTVVITLDAVMAGEGSVTVRRGDVVSVEEGQVVYVGGQVEKAGPVIFAEGLTVMQALLRAGGPSETARLRGAYIVRNGEKLPVNLRRISEGRDSDLAMQPGDQLYLKQSAF